MSFSHDVHLLIEHCQGVILGEVSEGVRGGPGAGSVHQIDQGTRFASETHPFVPHLGIPTTNTHTHV